MNVLNLIELRIFTERIKTMTKPTDARPIFIHFTNAKECGDIVIIKCKIDFLFTRYDYVLLIT